MKKFSEIGYGIVWGGTLALCLHMAIKFCFGH